MKSKEASEQEVITSRSTAIAITVAFSMMALCWIMKSEVAAFQAATLFGSLGSIIAWIHYFLLQNKMEIAAMLEERR